MAEVLIRPDSAEKILKDYANLIGVPVTERTKQPEQLSEQQIALNRERFLKRISNQIYYTDLNAIRQRINDFVRAKLRARTAFAPDWADLIRVYDQIYEDSVVTQVLKNFKNKIKAKEFEVVNQNGEKDEEATELLNSEWFFKYIDAFIEADFFPYSLIELGEWENNKFTDLAVVKREYIAPEINGVKRYLYGPIYPSYKVHSPALGTKTIRSDLKPVTGSLIAEYFDSPEYKDDYIFVKSSYDIGLFATVAIYVLGKNAAIQQWDRYNRMFGIPFRVGETDINDTGRRNNMIEMMDNWGTGGYAVIDLQDNIQFVTSSGSGQSNPFKMLIDYSDEQIARALQGAIGLGSEKSFVGSVESGERIFDEAIKSYCTGLTFNINDELLPRLELRNPIFAGKKFKFLYKETVPYKDRVDTIVKMTQAGYEFEDEQITEQIGMNVKKIQQPQVQPQQLEPTNALSFEDFVNQATFNDYPQGATTNAKRALKWRDEKGNPKGCGTNIGWTRANQLAKREKISIDTISRMARFKRHEKNKDVPYSEGCGGLMWDAWGGSAGINWAITKMKQIRQEAENFKEDNPELYQNYLNFFNLSYLYEIQEK